VEFLATLLALQLCRKVSVFGFRLDPPPVAPSAPTSSSDGGLSPPPVQGGDVQDEYRYARIDEGGYIVSLFSGAGEREKASFLGGCHVGFHFHLATCC
jgi:hypothetical protein